MSNFFWKVPIISSDSDESDIFGLLLLSQQVFKFHYYSLHNYIIKKKNPQQILVFIKIKTAEEKKNLDYIT